MIPENVLQMVGKLVNLAPHMSREWQGKLHDLVKWLRAAEAEGCFPNSAISDLAKAVPDQICFDIVRDLRDAGRTEPGGFLGPTKTEKREPARPKHIPLEPPPGIKWMDQGMDVQDMIDRIERVKGFGSALSGGPKVVTKDGEG